MAARGDHRVLERTSAEETSERQLVLLRGLCSAILAKGGHKRSPLNVPQREPIKGRTSVNPMMVLGPPTTIDHDGDDDGDDDDGGNDGDTDMNMDSARINFGHPRLRAWHHLLVRLLWIDAHRQKLFALFLLRFPALKAHVIRGRGRENRTAGFLAANGCGEISMAETVEESREITWPTRSPMATLQRFAGHARALSFQVFSNVLRVVAMPCKRTYHSCSSCQPVL